MGNFDITAVGSATTPVTANKVSTRFEQAAQAAAASQTPVNNPISPGQAVYFSPAFKFDPEAQVVIYVQRNTETGDVINQYPSKKVVEQYRQTAEGKAVAKLNDTHILPDAPSVTVKDDTHPNSDAAVKPATTTTVKLETSAKDTPTPVKSDI